MDLGPHASITRSMSSVQPRLPKVNITGLITPPMISAAAATLGQHGDGITTSSPGLIRSCTVSLIACMPPMVTNTRSGSIVVE